MRRIRVEHDGIIRLPAELRESVTEDDFFEIVHRPDGVIELRPIGHADPDQRWFWTERWQRMEHESDEDYAARRTRHLAEKRRLTRIVRVARHHLARIYDDIAVLNSDWYEIEGVRRRSFEERARFPVVP